MNVSVVDVAPGRSVNVEPPFVLTCHCTVGAGVPVADALNDAVWPAVTETSEGDEVTRSVGQEDVEEETEVFPLVALTIAKSWGKAVTTIAVVAEHPWLSVNVSVKLSVAGALSARSWASFT